MNIETTAGDGEGVARLLWEEGQVRLGKKLLSKSMGNTSFQFESILFKCGVLLDWIQLNIQIIGGNTDNSSSTYRSHSKIFGILQFWMKIFFYY